MTDKTRAASGGMGFIGWLQLLFIALKLLGKIDWSWWWVLSPALATAACLLLVFVVALLLADGAK